MEFGVSAHHNEYLPVGDATVDIILSVRASPGGSPLPPSRLAVVVLLDRSGSMGSPQAKMRAARQATIAAVDALPDGVAFAVIAGNQGAAPLYPSLPGLAASDETTRAEARAAIRRVEPHGGTAIGSWLRLAGSVLAGRPEAIGHALLLTDGRNETESRDELRAAVGECAFTADCVGIGSAEGTHDWDGTELLEIAGALGANPVVPVEDPQALPGALTRILGHALSAGTGDARLRIRLPDIATIRFVKQVHPVTADLTGRGDAGDYPLGAWSAGDRRDFHIGLDVGPLPAGTRRRVAWFASDDGPEVAATVEGTDDEPLFTAVHPTVAHYTAQQELATAVEQGTAALAAGDPAEATRLLRRVVALARAAGDTGKLALLGRVVHLDDPVRLRDDADPRRVPPVTVGGVRTAAARPAAPWSHCGETWSGAYCGVCGKAGPQ